MDWIKEYILSIVAAGVISGICISLVPKDSSGGMLIKMLAGIFLAVTMIAPLVKIRFDDLSDLWEDISLEADSLIQEGSAGAQAELSSVIKEELESYILDKANALGLTLEISVHMNQDDPPMPQKVSISGAASPYQKKVLSNFMEDELGITEAQQVWN